VGKVTHVHVPITVRRFLRSPSRHTAAALGLTLRRSARAAADRVIGGLHEPSFDPADAVPAEVVVYFCDRPEKLYQLQQWLPVLQQLHEQHRVLLVFRNQHSLTETRAATPLPAVYAHRLSDLLQLYQAGDYKVAVYVNNGAGNFQSLAVPRLLHVHINHGESDKVSMVSNTAKAYDRVFVAGHAAVLRHRAALMDLDEARLVQVGRPQLDLSPTPLLQPSPRPTVIYAPTWEGEDQFNNYTSLDLYGAAIAAAVLGLDAVRFVYKPHPRVPGSTDPGIRAGHRAVMQQIAAAGAKDPAAGHATLTEVDVLALFERCELMIADVSSVGLDFLYRRTDAPLFITDRRDDREALRQDAPVSAAADVIDSSTVAGLGALLAARLDHDDLLAERHRLREYYFGGLTAGESTKRFIAAIGEAIDDRDRMQAGRRLLPVGGESVEG
jgi:hypothetical protein